MTDSTGDVHGNFDYSHNRACPNFCVTGVELSSGLIRWIANMVTLSSVSQPQVVATTRSAAKWANARRPDGKTLDE